MGEDERRRHQQKALSARAVQTARAGDRARRLADGGGLYLFVSPGGAKSWVLRTVVKGRRCDLGLGGADLVSLAEALAFRRRGHAAHAGGGGSIIGNRHHVLTKDTPLTNLYVTILDKLGVPIERLGDSPSSGPPLIYRLAPQVGLAFAMFT